MSERPEIQADEPRPAGPVPQSGSPSSQAAGGDPDSAPPAGEAAAADVENDLGALLADAEAKRDDCVISIGEAGDITKWRLQLVIA